MEQIEKDFIKSYQSTLAKEGKELCEDILAMIDETDEMIMEKGYHYCNYFLAYKIDGVNKELVKRCKKYIENIDYFHRLETTFNQVNKDRRDEKRREMMENELAKKTYVDKDGYTTMTDNLRFNTLNGFIKNVK